MSWNIARCSSSCSLNPHSLVRIGGKSPHQARAAFFCLSSGAHSSSPFFGCSCDDTSPDRYRALLLSLPSAELNWGAIVGIFIPAPPLSGNKWGIAAAAAVVVAGGICRGSKSVCLSTDHPPFFAIFDRFASRLIRLNSAVCSWRMDRYVFARVLILVGLKALKKL